MQLVLTFMVRPREAVTVCLFSFYLTYVLLFVVKATTAKMFLCCMRFTCPQTDGQIERANRTVEDMLCASIGPQQNDWNTLVPIVEFAYNNSVQARTGFSPFYRNFDGHPHCPMSLAYLNLTVTSLTTWQLRFGLRSISMLSYRRRCICIMQRRQMLHVISIGGKWKFRSEIG
jgi:hypothetical protein